MLEKHLSGRFISVLHLCNYQQDSLIIQLYTVHVICQRPYTIYLTFTVENNNSSCPYPIWNIFPVDSLWSEQTGCCSSRGKWVITTINRRVRTTTKTKCHRISFQIIRTFTFPWEYNSLYVYQGRPTPVLNPLYLWDVSFRGVGLHPSKESLYKEGRHDSLVETTHLLVVSTVLVEFSLVVSVLRTSVTPGPTNVFLVGCLLLKCWNLVVCTLSRLLYSLFCLLDFFSFWCLLCR